METLAQINTENINNTVDQDSSLKVICLDLDETLIRATRIACNNTGGHLLKYWGDRVAQCRANELRQLLKTKPSDCSLNDEDYLRMKYGEPLFEDNPDIASPYRWFFPTDDFSNCWLLIRCYNHHHKMTSFYRVEYRPYCQYLIEMINKYKKHCNVKVVISTMATRQYGTLVCEGFKLFKGYYENIDGESKPFIDDFVGLEDWREKCWNHRFPAHYGKKSLSYIGLLFGVDPSHIIAVDDKPEIWSNVQQVIQATPYIGGIYLRQCNNNENNINNNNTNNDDNIKHKEQLVQQQASKLTLNKHKRDSLTLKVDNVLYKIAKYFESYLSSTIDISSNKRGLNEQYDKKTHLNLQCESSNPVSGYSKKDSDNKNDNNTNNNQHCKINPKNTDNKHLIINGINNNHIYIHNNSSGIKNTLITV